MASCLMSESPYPSQTQDKFVLRLPDGMRDRIKSAAESNNRSMNAEIVATLEEKYPAPDNVDIRHIADVMDRYQHAVIEMMSANSSETFAKHAVTTRALRTEYERIISEVDEEHLAAAMKLIPPRHTSID